MEDIFDLTYGIFYKLFENCVEPTYITDNIYVLEVDTDALGYERIMEDKAVAIYVTNRDLAIKKRDKALNLLEDMGFKIVYRVAVRYDKDVYVIKKD